MSAYKRCRPQLGTYVEISLLGADPLTAPLCVDAAFNAIERVSSVMSFYDSASDLSRLNQTRVGCWTMISADLAEVLALALELQHRSQGAFNVAIGGPLITWGLLPGSARGPGWAHLAEPGFALRGSRARRLLPVRLDLGGIAKGYAVDAAVETLTRLAPSIAGCVNAGGDLRVFGSRELEVWVRSGAPDAPKAALVKLRDEAVATSTVVPRETVSAHVDPRKRCPLLVPRTAVARARRCVVSDAFTKIALLLPQRFAAALAQSFGAEVCLLP